jgi:hypothetical protein
MVVRKLKMVGVRGFEPPTSASQTLRAKPTALHPADKGSISKKQAHGQSLSVGKLGHVACTGGLKSALLDLLYSQGTLFFRTLVQLPG